MTQIWNHTIQTVILPFVFAILIFHWLANINIPFILQVVYLPIIILNEYYNMYIYYKFYWPLECLFEC